MWVQSVKGERVQYNTGSESEQKKRKEDARKAVPEDLIMFKK